MQNIFQFLASKAIWKPSLKHDIFWEKNFPEKHILAAIYLWVELSKYVRGVWDESEIWLHVKSGLCPSFSTQNCCYWKTLIFTKFKCLTVSGKKIDYHKLRQGDESSRKVTEEMIETLPEFHIFYQVIVELTFFIKSCWS